MDVLFFDMECSDLKAAFGKTLCASFAWYDRETVHTEPWTFRFDEDPWRHGVNQYVIDDRKLVTAIRDQLEAADIVSGWNSKMFDVPFLNARLAKHDERPVEINLHADVMWYAGGRSMRIGSKKLDNVAKFFDFEDQKTSIDWDTWQHAAVGDPNAMDEVVEHCEADVKVLAHAYNKLKPYIRNIHR